MIDKAVRRGSGPGTRYRTATITSSWCNYELLSNNHWLWESFQPLLLWTFVRHCPTTTPLQVDHEWVSSCRDYKLHFLEFQVQIYNSDTNLVKRTISRFKETAYSARFRHDGRLLLTGSEEGVVKLFDLNNRLILRQFSGHSKSVNLL